MTTRTSTGLRTVRAPSVNVPKRMHEVSDGMIRPFSATTAGSVGRGPYWESRIIGSTGNTAVGRPTAVAPALPGRTVTGCVILRNSHVIRVAARRVRLIREINDAFLAHAVLTTDEAVRAMEHGA